MRSWLERAQQLSGPECDAALASAAYWSGIYESRLKAEPAAEAEPDAPAHWLYRIVTVLVVFVPLTWFLVRFGIDLVHLTGRIGEALFHNG